MNRDEMIRRVRDAGEPWDVAVVGGGATGLGVALDAAGRGWRTVLLEAGDFAGGTSSRSTKLVHGGVRYLREGQLGLVLEALRERAILRRNAPHLVQVRSFLLPARRLGERAWYGAGLALYDLLGGRHGFGRSRVLSREATIRRLPGVRTDGLRGGVLFRDGQFDDARLAVAIARTAAADGAALVTRARVTAVTMTGGRATGLVAEDAETGETLAVEARAIVNATGVFVDAVRRLADPGARPMLRPSRGVHLVLDREFLPGEDAILLPRTDDGRVAFLVPWEGSVLVGTTDTPVDSVVAEPRADAAEIAFLLDHAGRVLTRAPRLADVRSVFAGLRPLVDDGHASTASLSRDHVVRVERSGMVTVTGGKWTTYRRMAADALDVAARTTGMAPRPCRTVDRAILGAEDGEAREALARSEPGLAAPVHPALALRGVDVAWAAREEMARTVEDVLARRSRALLLDARAAAEGAGAVADLLAVELDRDAAWSRAQAEAFRTLAVGYLPDATA